MVEEKPMMGCWTCRRPLARFTGPSGTISYIHMKRDQMNHPPMAVPISEIGEFEHVCDFCCDETAAWVYTTGEKVARDITVKEGIGVKDRQELHHEDRGQSRLTTYRESEKAVVAFGYEELSSPTWAACETCAALIERKAMSRLVTRAKQAATDRGGYMVRADLVEIYGQFFNLLLPGRIAISEWVYPTTL